MPQDMEKKPQERGERRERGPRRDRRPESEFQEKMVAINRVTKVVKGGRNFRFAALVVIGDGKGRVGCGIGKATEIPEAARKATEDAKKHLVHVSMKGTSIPHETVGRFGTGEIVLLPAPEGTGVIAGGPARAVLELCGVKDIRTKSYGSNNPINMVKATIEGLASLRNGEDARQDRRRAARLIRRKRRMKLQVTLVKSPVSSKPNHIKIVKALGLHKIRSTKVFEDTPSIRGMIFKVSHLVSVVEISD